MFNSYSPQRYVKHSAFTIPRKFLYYTRALYSRHLQVVTVNAAYQLPESVID